VKTIMVEKNEEIELLDGRYFEIVLMNLTEGSEPVDAGNLGANSIDGGAAYEKERLPVWSFTEGTWRVTSEEERVDPGCLRFSLSTR